MNHPCPVPFAYLLIIALELVVCGCGADTTKPTPIDTPHPTTVLTPSESGSRNVVPVIPITPCNKAFTLSPASTTNPDARIAQFESLGIHFTRPCATPCSEDVYPGVRLDQIVQCVGAPEKVYATYGGGPDFAAMLIYATRGFEVYAFRPIKEDFTTMTPDMVVGRIDHWKSRPLPDLEREIPFNIPLQKAQEWKGFGPIGTLPK